MIARVMAWLLAGIAAIGGAWLAGKRSGAVRAENKAMREDAKAHERITDAEKRNRGVVSDADRRKRLLDLANKLNGN